MRKQVKGIVEHLVLKTSIKNFNFHLIPRTKLWSKCLSFLHRNHKVSVFTWQKTHFYPDTVVYLIFFNSVFS